MKGAGKEEEEVADASAALKRNSGKTKKRAGVAPRAGDKGSNLAERERGYTRRRLHSEGRAREIMHG